MKARYERWLEESADVLATIDDATLASVYHRPDNPERGMWATSRTRAECILHAMEHTGIHLGHLQLQRQLWDAEHDRA